jgi:hypothetical protein
LPQDGIYVWGFALRTSCRGFGQVQSAVFCPGVAAQVSGGTVRVCAGTGTHECGRSPPKYQKEDCPADGFPFHIGAAHLYAALGMLFLSAGSGVNAGVVFELGDFGCVRRCASLLRGCQVFLVLFVMDVFVEGGGTLCCSVRL